MILKRVILKISESTRTRARLRALPITNMKSWPSETQTLSLSQLQFRGYCTNPPKITPFPALMQFNQIVWPSLFVTIKNFFLTHIVIRPNLDPDFGNEAFIEGTKQAVKVISEALHQNDFGTLESLVSKEAFKELQESVSKFSVSEREQLPINIEDIYFTFPYQVGMIMEDDGRRWVEVTMAYHVLRGFTEMKERGVEPPMSLGLQPEYQQKLFVCNYRFIREYTKGVTDSWLVNIVNHFRLQDFKNQ